MNLTNKVKEELARIGMRPNKTLGQNFLINEGIYKKMVAALEITEGKIIVEVGPGLGTLTEYLAASGANVIAVEKDRLLVDFLKNKFANQKNVIIIEEDILKFNPATCNLKPETYKIVGNIPYYLTSHLLRIIFETWPTPQLIVLMLQKEVAQRIVAKPPKMSLLAVSVQYYAKPEIISYVSSGSFYPPPKVDSAIVKLVPSDQGLVTSERPDHTNHYSLITNHFFRVVRAGFASKRKQLANNLARELKLTKSSVEDKLSSASVDPKRRAETLTIAEWQELVKVIYDL